MRTVALTRQFSLLSLGLLILAGLLIGVLIRQHEVRQLETVVEERNVVMTRIFQNVLAADFQAVLDTPAQRSDPRPHPLAYRIADIIRGSDIVKIKLYNRDGSVVFSTDPTQLGENKRENPGFQNALNGRTFSELTHRDRFSASEGELVDVDLVSSYVPFDRDGQVQAVFELYQEVTPLLARIEKALAHTMGIVLGVLALFFLIQQSVLRYARRAIQAQESLLETANRELDVRISERTRALEESQQRVTDLLQQQQLIFDNAQVGILLLQNRRILKGNQRIADMFGYASPADFEGRTTAIFYRDEAAFREAGEAGYRQLSEHGYAHFEVPMRRKNGEDFWVIQSGRPLNPRAVLDSPSIWVYTDITERKRAEVEMSIAAAAFESQEGMMVTDAQCVILRVNKAFSDTTGYAPEEVIGRTPRLLRSDRHDAAFFAAMWDSIRHTGFWQGEIWDRHKSGKVYPKWLTISAVKDASGTVTHYVGTHTDITERKIAEERIRHLAFYDQLTALPNRTLLMDRLRHAMAASERNRRYGALLFLDLDHFKVLNDTLGHDQGDLLLKEVAHTLASHVRHGDTVARLGGDEFVILLLDLEEEAGNAALAVETICRKLLAVLDRDYRLNGGDIHLSASIGATLFVGEATGIDELLKQADLAMYRSKEAGRNAFNFFDPAMEAEVVARIEIEADLRRAVQADEFRLFYQPQVRGSDNAVIGAEVLIRWQHPTRGLLTPDTFIPRAEECGLILPIGQWVIETACRQLAVWALQPERAHLTLAVNVSVHQFNQPDFVEQVLGILERSGANPRRLKLELTESLFVEHVDEAIRKMAALKLIGVGFSLDDFGTGYSSLGYLSRLPLDQLKIDRSFVSDLDSRENNVAICAATISLAHSLRLQVVAEGVETDAQRYFLTAVHRCDYLQGYLFGRPQPLADFEDHLSASGTPRGA